MQKSLLTYLLSTCYHMILKLIASTQKVTVYSNSESPLENGNPIPWFPEVFSFMKEHEVTKRRSGTSHSCSHLWRLQETTTGTQERNMNS